MNELFILDRVGNEKGSLTIIDQAVYAKITPEIEMVEFLDVDKNVVAGFKLSEIKGFWIDKRYGIG